MELAKARKAHSEDDQDQSEERFPIYEVGEGGITWVTKPGESKKRFVIEEFDPEEDDAYEDLVGVLQYARDRVESAKMGGVDDAYPVSFFRKGVGAWDFYRDTTGVDMEGIASPWKKVPNFFVPLHVIESYGHPECRSLIRLLNDAVGAYVFGAHTAAIAMCRAVCEDVLKQCFGLEIQLDTRGYGPQLSKIIILAEEEFDWVRQLNVRP